MVILNLDASDIQNDYEYEQIAIFDENGEVIAVPGSATDPRNWRSNIDFECSKLNINICTLLIRTHHRLTDKPIDWSKKAGDINEDQFYILRPNLPEDSEIHIQRTFNYIKKIRDYASKNNMRFILVTYPRGYQVSPEEWKIGKEKAGLEPTNNPSLLLFEKAEDFSNKNDITYADTYYKFSNSDIFPLFYNHDIHMTKDGYRLIAEGIFEFLEKDEEFIISVRKNQ